MYKRGSSYRLASVLVGMIAIAIVVATIHYEWNALCGVVGGGLATLAIVLYLRGLQ